MVKKESAKPKPKFPIKHEGIVKINDRKLKEDFVCDVCLMEIHPNDRFVVVGTHELKEKEKENLYTGFVAEHFYHIQCWVDYFNKKVIEKLSESQSQALKFLSNNPLFQNLTKNMALLKV